METPWTRRLARSLSPTSWRRRRRSRQARSRHLRHFLAFEPVEGRTLLATITWNLATGGDWNLAGNWDLNRVPTAGDDVVIPDLAAAGADQTITFGSGTVTVQSITNAESLAVSGGTLTTNGNLAGPGQLLVQGGTFRFAGASWTNTSTVTQSGGTVQLGGTFRVADLGAFTGTAGTVSATGTLDDPGATLSIDAARAWQVRGGTLRGITVAGAPGALLRLADARGGPPTTARSTR